MVLTVTLNPLLERRKYFNRIELGKDNRAVKEEFSAGGKGINVSRQLNLLGIKNSALTFLGGNNGKILRSIFTSEHIEYSSVNTKSETRAAEIIIENDSKRITTFFGCNALITNKEVEEFKYKLDKSIQNCAMVVFAGSSPCTETDDIFSYGIELANKYDKISVLDTYGNHLLKCLQAAPTVIHNNISEVEYSIGISLQNEKEILNYLQHLYSLGIKLAFLTNGENQTYASKYDFLYKIYPPKILTIDSTGSGDAFVTGIVFGLENSLVFDDFVKIATALGTANASILNTCSVSKELMNEYIDKVVIEPIGKKMKLIDDSPTVK